jgi:hypothetical protein
MDLIHPICAGLDVRSADVIACVRREIEEEPNYAASRIRKKDCAS